MHATALPVMFNTLSCRDCNTYSCIAIVPLVKHPGDASGDVDEAEARARAHAVYITFPDT